MANGNNNRTKNRRDNARGGSHAHRGKPPGKPTISQSRSVTAAPAKAKG